MERQSVATATEHRHYQRPLYGGEVLPRNGRRSVGGVASPGGWVGIHDLEFLVREWVVRVSALHFF